MRSFEPVPVPGAVGPEHGERRGFYERIGRQGLAPLWEVLHALVPREPRSPCLPAGWHYHQVRPCMLEAGALITAQEAERRVLILENPGLRGASSITQTLYAGIQLLLPGEVAPSHRHTQSALRLVLEGECAYTAVDGERTTMRPGDLVITPSMTWHDHGNPGADPVTWLDGLDIPLVRTLDAGFLEKYPRASQPVSRPEGSAAARFGSNLLPLDHELVANGASPILNYRFAQTRSALAGLAVAQAPHPCHGHALRFVNPATGRSPIPTIGTYVYLLPARFQTRQQRATDGKVFCCLEGEGHIEVQESEGSEAWTFEFSRNDVFVVPSWRLHRLRAGPATVLFSFSDRPIQEALGVYRQDLSFR